MAKIELSDKKIIRDATTIWNQPGPEVDLVMDLKNLTYREGSLDGIFAFHVADYMFLDEAQMAFKNWYQCLKTGSSVFIIVDDFEYISRAFVGGDISVEVLNKIHNHPTQYTRDYLAKLLFEVGFKENNVKIWFENPANLFNKKHYELVIEATK